MFGQDSSVDESDPPGRDRLNGLGHRDALGGEDPGGEARGRVIRLDGASPLQNDLAVIVDLVDGVHGAATLGISVREDGGMNPIAVHAWTTMSGKQGWMDVHHPILPP